MDLLSKQRQRRQSPWSLVEPGFGQMLLVSVLLHLLLPALYFSPLFPARKVEKPPVYRVNLINKPVENPQAGRPEALPKEQPAAARPAPEPPKQKPAPAPVPVRPAPKPEPPPKPKPEPKAEPKPAPKPEPEPPKPQPAPEPKPQVSAAEESALQQRLSQLRAAQDQQAREQARQQRLADLKAAALAEANREVSSPISEAPVGMPDGSGDQQGVSAVAFVREFIQRQWRFSRYQASGSPEAEVVLSYSAEGTQLHYRFIRKSGDEAFDDSLRRAIVKAKQLPQPLPRAMEFQIVFNLKDMLNR